MSQNSFRETTAAPHNTDQYLAFDINKLSYRLSRRLTTPDSTPDLVESKSSGPSAAAAPAGVAPSKLPLATADKRALPFSSLPNTHHASKNLDTSRGISSTSSSGQSTRCCSIGRTSPGQLDYCVKEDDSGQSLTNSPCPRLFTQ